MKNLKRLLLNSVLVGLLSIPAWAVRMTGGTYEISKDLVGDSGSPYMSNVNYSLAASWGEPVAGDLSINSTNSVVSGYYGGRFGNSPTFALVSWQIGEAGSKAFMQDNLRIGVPFDAPVALTFGDQINQATIPNGIQAVMIVDHLGNPASVVTPLTPSIDPTNHIITVTPQGAWTGNSLYDIQVLPALENIDGFQVDQVYHIYFVTALDHRVDNVVLDPMTAPGLPAAVPTGAIASMSIQIPSESLSDFSAILASRDPLTAPLQVDPKIVQEANDKARAAGGDYRVPLAVQEIAAYNTQGQVMSTLTKPAELTINYGSANFAAPGVNGGLIRPQTLALWVLDQTHRLWVKIPASQNVTALQTLTAPVSQLSVFALMGSADGSAADSNVFPVPWRPHGPNAGTGAGQTGTEADGMTFTNLPSECTINIYTISGDLVRQLEHSDTRSPLPQEKWDGKTTHGDTVASGVYLWRVESSVDGKNGKLMIIR